jgi:hypothetical protein
MGYEPCAIPLIICVFLCFSVPVHSLDRDLSVSFCVFLCFFCVCLRFQQETIHFALPIITKTSSHCLPTIFPAPYQAYYIIFPAIIMSLSKTILASILKLNNQNWHTWSKETKAYLTMEEFWELVDPTEIAPTSVANIKHDKKAYAHIWFLVEPNCWDSIVNIKSGHDAWAALKAEHKKDTLLTCMNLCQHLYALSHDPVVGVMPFINDILTVVCQLESINYKPTMDEITDKLLINLHSSFAAVCTNLLLCMPEPSIKEITTALKELKTTKCCAPPFPLQLTLSSKMNPPCMQIKDIFMGVEGVGLNLGLIILTGEI